MTTLTIASDGSGCSAITWTTEEEDGGSIPTWVSISGTYSSLSLSLNAPILTATTTFKLKLVFKLGEEEIFSGVTTINVILCQYSGITSNVFLSTTET